MLQLVKSILGVALLDAHRYVAAMLARGDMYLRIRNRTETLVRAPDGSGYRCSWQWTSNLHAPTVFHSLGRWLMGRALSDHPINRMIDRNSGDDEPEVSFIIGHRGTARLPLLLATLDTIAGQDYLGVECIVVEQDTQSEIATQLPSWVRHVHTPSSGEMPYCRSWAFNVGATLARGRILVLHDNDLLVPKDYATQLVRRVKQGFDVVNLKRFIFYLSELDSRHYLAKISDIGPYTPEVIMQNAEAGGSVAITREAFVCIGGMDESFIGWGGEDNEFWERAQTCRVWPYGYLPLVHLWHPSQPKKQQLDNPTLLRSRMLSATPVDERISRLRATSQGLRSGPAGYASDNNPCGSPQKVGA